MQPAFESAAPRGDQDVVSSPATNRTAPVQRATCAADSFATVTGGSTIGDGIAGIAASTDVARRSSFAWVTPSDWQGHTDPMK